MVGEAVFDILNDLAAKRIDHRQVVDDNGDKRFAYRPGAGLLGAIDGVLGTISPPLGSRGCGAAEYIRGGSAHSGECHRP